MSDHSLLETIESPVQLRRLERRQLPALADQLRAFLIESVSKTGGHLSSNLGTVELSIALHYVFDTPRDRLVWDVGHQTYGHKTLTGRRDAMSTLRKFGGISGFPKRSESEYDTFGTAHSSTSISAALGMAVAARAEGSRRHNVAVIGDGAMSAGMAFEALNNAGDMIVIKDEQGNVFLAFDTATDGAGLDFGADQSVTRSPDIEGDFTLHTDANSALLFSPGTRTDGTGF